MASKLLNVLNKVETGRQGLITVLNTKDIPIALDASFSQIAGLLNGAELGEFNDLTLDLDTTYYDDPEDDPEVFSVPESYPDSKAIFDELVENDVKYSTTYPIIKRILFFKTDSPTTIFSKNSTGTPAQNELRIFYYYNDRGTPMMTSDGSRYFINNTTTVTHTWDTTKDIIGPTGEHFKYIVLFCAHTQPDSSITSSTIGSDIELTELLQNIAETSGYPSDTKCFPNDAKPIPYYHFVYDPRSNTPNIDAASIPVVVSRRIDVDIDPSEAIVNSMTTTTRSQPYIAKYLNTIYIKDIEHTTIDFNINKSVVYLRTKTFKNFTLSNVGGEGNASSISHMKYLVYNPTAQAALTLNPTLVDSMPRLKDRGVFQYSIFKPIAGSSVFTNIISNYKNVALDLTNILDGSQVTSLNSEHTAVALNETITTWPFTHGTNCKKLTITGLKHFTVTGVANTYNVKRLDLLDVEDITKAITDSSTNHNNLNYIYAPKLYDFTGFTGTNPFYNAALYKLVLGNNVIGNLNLKTNKNLLIESAIDIMHKLKDLTGTGTQYTITFYRGLGDYLKGVGLDKIATDKGWRFVSSI